MNCNTDNEDPQNLKEAAYYEPMHDGKVICLLCPNKCHIEDNQYGLCHNRKNFGGRLYTLAYGHLCALHSDPIEKKPLSHFLPGTNCLSLASAGCNLSCLNCQNWQISQATPHTKGTTFSCEDIVRLAQETGCPSVAYTYTEPLTYLEYILDCTRACKNAGIKNVLVSAGYINEQPLSDILPYLDAANIDLKSFSDSTYRRINRGRLQPVLHTLELMRKAGIWIEITNLVIPTINDDRNELTMMCQWLVKHGFADCPLHFSRFFPRYKMQDLPSTPLPTLLKAYDIARKEGMKYVYIGNTSLPDVENTYCPTCHRLLVWRHGNSIEQLFSNGTCPECATKIPGVWSTDKDH